MPTENQDTGFGTDIPSYLIAASNHSLLNATPDESLLEKVGDTVVGIPKFVGLSLGSGLVQAWNTIPTVANWIGGDFDKVDYRSVISDLDTDLGQYYRKHELGIDTVGFMAGSLLPGMVGVKALNAGQTVLRGAITSGTIGSNMGRALGLLAPDTEGLLAAAKAAITTTGNPFAMIEANTMKALGAGFVQNTLESGAFMTMVTATMQDSPVLKDMDAKDLMWNALSGTAIGGILGGSISGLFTRGAIKAAGREADLAVAPWSLRAVPQPNASASDIIAQHTLQLQEMPPIPTEGDLAPRINALAQKTTDSLRTRVRSAFTTLANDDQAVAQSQYDVWKIQMANGDGDKAIGNLIDSTGIGRASAVTRDEQTFNRLEKLRKLDPTMAGVSPEDLDTWSRLRVNWVKMRGTDSGDVTNTIPEVLSLTDRMKAGDSISLTKDGRGIQIGNKVLPQENNPYRPFNIMAASHYQTEARQFWAELLPKFDEVEMAARNTLIHETDIPLLDKVVRDGVGQVKIIPENSAIDEAYTLVGRDHIQDFVRQQKNAIAQRLAVTQPAVHDLDAVVDKLRSSFGINFNVVDDPAGGYNGFWSRVKQKLFPVAGSSKSLEVSGDAIAMNRVQTLTRSMSEVARTLKHEEGHGIFQTLLDARGISRLNLDAAMPDLHGELVQLSKRARPSLWKSTNPRDIDYRQSNHELFADAFSWLSLHPDQLKKFPEFNQFAGHLVRPVPQSVVDSVARRATIPTPAEIAKIVNVDEGVLRGEVGPHSWNARDHERLLYKQQMAAAETRATEQVSDPMHLPSWVKVISKESRTTDLDGNIVNGMTAVAERARLYEDAAKRVTAPILGEGFADISLKQMMESVHGGPTFAGYENSNYGTTGSYFAYAGQRLHNIIKNMKEGTSDIFNPTLSKIANDLDSAIEWSVLNEKMRALPNKYKFDLETASLKLAVTDPVALADLISSGAPQEIPIKSQLVQQLVQDHISRNGGRINALKPIRANEGFMDKRDPETFYPIPRSPKDTPHFAFVIDDSVQGAGHSSMIYAADAEKLAAMKNEILQKRGDLMVLTKDESEQYFKAHGQFDFERTLNERNINWELKRNGVSASFLPMTDPKRIVNSFLDWHLDRDASLAREALSHRYSRQFDTLRASAGESQQAAKSQFGYSPSIAKLESGLDNPAMNLIKMALDIQRTTDFPYWSSFGQMLDSWVSKKVADVSKLWENATHPDHLANINAALNKAGYGNLVVDEGLYNIMNAKVPRGTLTAVVNKMNGLLGSLALRMDPLNAINNLIGTNVLMGTELKSVTRAIEQGNSARVGDLAKLMDIEVPSGAGATIRSPAKLIANAMSRVNDPTIKVGGMSLKDYYRSKGFVSTIIDQYDQTLDQLALSASDTVPSLEAKIAGAMQIAKKIGNTGERLTGNTFAEHYSRMITADVMKQITDVAVGAGVMDESTALTYINTFVNRVQGNYIAAQRPMMFQGPIGQAIGLFQTYQFNLLQQLLRHVQDGEMKNIATMMGLQGTLYGMNGLPAFNAINTYIVGEAAGNKGHTDLYQSAYSAAGKQAGDWLVYGGLSNAMGIFHPDLKSNMYSRGDINPRSITLVPVDPSKVPIVSAFSRMVSNIYNMSKQTAAGGDIFPAFVRSLEHNGVSRPLAGMAQVFEGALRPDQKVISTSNQDDILMAHDLYSMASLLRLVGGKPLDEALTNDAMFRINAYRTADATKMQTLAEAVKLNTLEGTAPDQEHLDQFMHNYVSNGGKQDNFVKFMARQYKNVNMSQANQLRDKLSAPQGVGLQRLMGGMELSDLSNTAAYQTAVSSSNE